MTDKIELPLCFEIKNKQRELRHNLKILPNGLIVCKIKISNPNKPLEITCNALIDTGAEITLINESLFTKLSFDEEKIFERGASTLDNDIIVKVVNINMVLPHNNHGQFQIGVYVKNLDKREEYDAIIGMNILQNFQLVYHGIQKTAWLDEL